ncbi:MAG: hypothetical protein C0483_06465 [Pirellula sp.]|nr:hypothetical protein [Pirellula sp.]
MRRAMYKRLPDCGVKSLGILAIAISGYVAGLKVAAAADSPYTLITTEAQRVRAVLQFEIDVPNLQASEWILFVARPPLLPGQRVQSATLEPRGVPYNEISELRRPLLRARIPNTSKANENHVEAASEFEATLYARHLAPDQVGAARPAVASPTKAEREAALRKTPMFDFGSKPFSDWLDKHRLHRRTQENDVDFGRRVFLAIVKSCEYEYAAQMTRNATHVCTTSRSDCGGMAVLFAAAMRANDIPARVLSGCWAKSSEPAASLSGVRYYQTHVKAEFFAADVGWVPVDLSSAVLHDKSAEKTRYFGHDAGDFLTMHVDPELKIDTIHFGVKTVPWLQQFHYYATGKGKIDGAKYTMDWKVTKQ